MPSIGFDYQYELVDLGVHTESPFMDRRAFWLEAHAADSDDPVGYLLLAAELYRRKGCWRERLRALRMAELGRMLSG